jgi:hypothetical protein
MAERMASDSVSSSSRALMAEDKFNSDELGLGCACNWCEGEPVLAVANQLSEREEGDEGDGKREGEGEREIKRVFYFVKELQ